MSSLGSFTEEDCKSIWLCFHPCVLGYCIKTLNGNPETTMETHLNNTFLDVQQKMHVILHQQIMWLDDLLCRKAYRYQWQLSFLLLILCSSFQWSDSFVLLSTWGGNSVLFANVLHNVIMFCTGLKETYLIWLTLSLKASIMSCYGEIWHLQCALKG